MILFAMQIREILLFITALTSPSVGIAQELCVQSGIVYSPAVEYRSSDNRRSVLVLGMAHEGPKEYFDNVNKAMSDFMGASPSAILKEFITCTADTVNSATGSSLSREQFAALQASQGRFQSMNLTQLANTVGTEDLRKESCVPDAAGVSRPEYYVRYTSDYCGKLHKVGMQCQYTDFKIPSGPNISQIQGDWQMNSMPAGTQWFAGSIYNRSWKSNLGQDARDQLARWEDGFSIEQRNAYVLGIAKNALKSKEKVVIPWGAGHIRGLARRLEDMGFKNATNRRIAWTATSKIKNKEFLRNVPACGGAGVDEGKVASSVTITK